MAPAPAGSRADALLTQARLLAEQGRVTLRQESLIQYISLNPEWAPIAEDRFIGKNPPGLPVLLAAAWRAEGREAAFFVSPALASATLLMLFLLCRPWVGGGLALLAALAFAAHPLANQHAVQPDGHGAATFFLVAGLWLLDAWGRKPAAWRALLAGLALGALPAIRFAEAAAGLGVALFLLLQAVRMTGARRQALLVLLGAALPAGLLLVYSHYAYGSAWEIAPALAAGGEPSLEGLAANWEPLFDGLMLGGAGLFFAFGLAGLAGMLVQPALRPLAACLALVILGITGLRTAFPSGIGQDWLRFLLPTLPLYLLPALWFFRLLGPGRVPRAALFVLLALHVGRGLPDSMIRLEAARAEARQSADAIAWLDQNVPAGSILIGDPALFGRISFTGNWRLADKALLLAWNQFGGLAHPNPVLDQWAGSERAVYWVGSRNEAQDFVHMTEGWERLEPAGALPLAEPAEVFRLRR